MTERRKTGVMWRQMLVIAVMAASMAPAAHQNDVCNQPLTEDLTLDQDVSCAGDGIVVDADGITVDLNGHKLAGVGSGVGILVSGQSDVTIMNGTITGFAVAVRTNTATDVVIKRVAFADNAEGIDFQAGSVGNTVKNSEFSGSTVRAIMLRSNSRDNDIKDNTFRNNRLGILVFGGVDNTLKDNTVSGSSLVGIRFNVIATGNVAKDNFLQDNVAGFEFVVTPTGSAVGNELKDNTLAGNVCGIKGPAAGNDLADNSFEGNISDTCS